MTEPIFKRMQTLERENAELKNQVVRLKNDLYIAQHRLAAKPSNAAANYSDRVASRNNFEMIAQWSSKGLDWRNSNSTMRGKLGGAETRGRLEIDYYWELAQKAAYVIYAWETPIYWINTDGSSQMPDVNYSPTTTQKQNLVKASFAELTKSE